MARPIGNKNAFITPETRNAKGPYVAKWKEDHSPLKKRKPPDVMLSGCIHIELMFKKIAPRIKGKDKLEKLFSPKLFLMVWNPDNFIICPRIL